MQIRYQFHSNGLIEGDIVKGFSQSATRENITFFCCVCIRLYADTSAGRIKNLNDFTDCKKQCREAYHLFYSVILKIY